MFIVCMVGWEAYAALLPSSSPSMAAKGRHAETSHQGPEPAATRPESGPVGDWAGACLVIKHGADLDGKCGGRGRQGAEDKTRRNIRGRGQLTGATVFFFPAGVFLCALSPML